jgi:hypothetical protein
MYILVVRLAQMLLIGVINSFIIIMQDRYYQVIFAAIMRKTLTSPASHYN